MPITILKDGSDFPYKQLYIKLCLDPAFTYRSASMTRPLVYNADSCLVVSTVALLYGIKSEC